MTSSAEARAQIPQRPRRAARVAERLVEGELVLYDPLHQRVHVLNATAAVVWRLCSGTNMPDDIVAILVEHYPQSRPVIEVDLSRILGQFRAEELLET